MDNVEAGSAISDTIESAALGYVELLPRAPRPWRGPHIGHLAILAGLFLLSFAVIFALAIAAIAFHWFHIASFDAASRSLAFNLFTMAGLYLFAIGPAVLIFPGIWKKSFAGGISWNLGAVWEKWSSLLLVPVSCLIFAAFLNLVFPFRATSTPIARLVGASQNLWMVGLFAILVAPLCEEIICRGFLLPASATSVDWILGKTFHKAIEVPARSIAEDWSLPAQAAGVAVSASVFALLHSPQYGNLWQPVLNILFLGIALSIVRIKMRSLAASVYVHASYNFLLCLVMFAGKLHAT